MASDLTTSQLESAIAEVLTEAGYVEVESSALGLLDRLFEDEYGIVAVAVFSELALLVSQWPDAQGEFVDLLSAAFDRSEPKAWEGYLVLATLDDPTADISGAVAAIRRDIRRVRKLVITGSEIPSLSSLAMALLPVRPLDTREEEIPPGNLLEVLPATLEESIGVERRITASVVGAYLENEPLMEAIHREVHP